MPIILKYQQISKPPKLDADVVIVGIEKELERIGTFLVKELHDRIPPGASKGNFPGDGPPTGKLKSSIRRRRAYQSKSGQWTMTVFINRQYVKDYWYVHEEGKVIFPKRKKFMYFHYKGRSWKASRVVIKPKWYMRDSIIATEADILLNTPSSIRSAVAASVRIQAP